MLDRQTAKASEAGLLNQLTRFALAHHGDIFPDEVNSMPIALQAKLLRILQEREIEPIGARNPTSLKFRVLSACNETLEKACSEGRMRSDLMYRLKQFVIYLPTLRSRKEDIPLLCRYIWQCHGMNARGPNLTRPALQLLQDHSWPGNVRELASLLHVLALRHGEGIIERSDVQRRLHHEGSIDCLPPFPVESQPAVRNLQSMVETFEQRLIAEILRMVPSMKDAAAILGINRRTLQRKLYGK